MFICSDSDESCNDCNHKVPHEATEVSVGEMCYEYGYCLYKDKSVSCCGVEAE